MVDQNVILIAYILPVVFGVLMMTSAGAPLQPHSPGVIHCWSMPDDVTCWA